MTRRPRQTGGRTDEPEIRPSVRYSDPPPWYDLSEDQFEDLCQDVHGLSAHITRAFRYGRRGETQKGVDILADRDDGKREAAQCKRHREFTKATLDGAITEFQKNLDHWKNRDVVLFRIYSATKVRSTTVLNALHQYQAEFRDLALDLELCDGHELSRTLSQHRPIVSLYLPSYWTDVICGPLQPVAPGDHDHQLQGLRIHLDLSTTELGELADSLSRQVADRIATIREHYRRGHRRAARADLLRILDSEDWSRLSPEVQSRALRLMAVYVVNLDGDIVGAREFAARADPAVQDSLSRSLDALLRLNEHEGIPDQTADATPETTRLRAAALLECGRAGEALETLTSAPDPDAADAESHRLVALAYLALDDVASARSAVDRAIQLNPLWLSVREVDAIITFWEGAGIPAGVPINHYLPGPFPREFVRADDTAVRRISQAGERFARLAEDADDPDESLRLRLWQFICSANSPPHGRAMDLLQTLLEQDPGSPMVLSWALSRRLPFDREEALAALSAATPEQPDYPDRIGLRVGLLLEANREEAGLELLEESSQAFIEARHAEGLAHWRVQALVALGRYEEAINVLQSVSNQSLQERLRMHVERLRAAASDDPAPLLDVLKDAYQSSGGLDVLFEIVEMHLRAGNPEAAEAFGSDLLEGAPTPSTIRLVTRAHWEARRPRACLELLSAHAYAFPGQELPEDLRRLGVYCRRKLGLLVEAIEDAQLIAQVENTPQAWIDLLEVQTDHGHFAGLEDTARRVLAADGISQEELLRAAGVVAISNPSLARQLWDRALAQGPLEDALVLAAFTLGNQLGASGSELAPLGQRIAELGDGDSSLVRAMNIDEALEVMRASREQAEELHAKYAHGDIPLHILPDGYRPAVLEIFSTSPPLRPGPPDPSVQPPIFGRHGGWPIRDATPPQNVILLDVTSLVLATSLGVLDQLIDRFDSVRIPRATQRLLISEISQLRPQQRERATATERVLQRIRSGGITVEPESIPWSPDRATCERMGAWWVARIERTRGEGGLAVDFLPLSAHDGNSEPPDVPEDLLGSITSPHAVARALAVGGALSDSELRERVERLGTSAGPGDGVPVPRRAQHLYVSSGVAELLSQADLLNVCCDYFSVAMFENDRDRIVNEVEGNQLRNALADWGQEIVQDTSRRVEAGQLVLITPLEGGDESPSAGSPASECLFDLLRSDVPESLVCSDDRFVNRYAVIEQRPTTSIPDLLALLRSEGRLTQQTFFDVLHRLRCANYRYLPLLADEIIHRLRGTRGRGGSLKESDELATLRTWWAGCCLGHSALQKPGEQSDGSSEAAFLVNSRRAISDAMKAIWRDGRTGPETRAARARWLMDALFVGLVESRHHIPAHGQDLGGHVPALAGADVAFLCSDALSLDWTRPARGAEKPAAEEYLAWLLPHYIEPILAADAHLAETAANSLRDLILGVVDDTPGEVQRAAMVSLLGRFLQKLPDVLREGLARDPAIARLFGFRSYSAIDVAGYTFDSDEFWEACAEAVNGQRGQVRPLDDGAFLFVRRSGTGESPPDLELVRADASIAGHLVDPFFGVLSADHSETATALEASPHWTDGDRRSGGEIAHEVQTLRPAERVDLIHSLAGRSAADRYHRLEAGFEEDNRLSIDQLAPWHLEPIARYFRVSEADHAAPFSTVWSSASARLIQDLGLRSALDRILCVPSAVPQVVIDRIDALTDREANEVLNDQQALNVCPVSLINLLRITARSRHARTWRQTLATEIVGRITGEAFRLDFEMTKAIASRLATRVAASGSDVEMRSDVRLAAMWGHAARVVNIVRRTAEPSAGVIDWIRTSSPETAGIFRLDRGEQQDFWSPRHVSAPHLMFDGLAAALHDNDFRGFRDCLEDLRSLLRRFPSSEESWMLAILGDPALRNDILSSGMSQARERLVEIFGEDAARFTSAQLEKQAEQAIAALETDPTASDPWMQLSAIVCDLPIYPNLTGKLRKLVERLPLASLCRDDWMPFALAAPIVAANDARDATEASVWAFVDRLPEALRLASRFSSEDGRRRILEQVVEAAYAAAAGLASETERRRVFFEALSRLLFRSPILCDLMAPGILNLRRTLTSDARSELSQVLFACRARGSRDWLH